MVVSATTHSTGPENNASQSACKIQAVVTVNNQIEASVWELACCLSDEQSAPSTSTRAAFCARSRFSSRRWRTSASCRDVVPLSSCTSATCTQYPRHTHAELLVHAPLTQFPSTPYQPYALSRSSKFAPAPGLPLRSHLWFDNRDLMNLLPQLQQPCCPSQHLSV